MFGFFLLLIATARGESPVISRVSVSQESIVVYDDSCTGIIEVEMRDADNDSLLLGLQISSDGGKTWQVPFLSNFFITSAPGNHAIPFTVKGRHGPDCVAKVTVYDSLPRRGKSRLIPAAGHTFLMGSDRGKADERPVHPVAFSHDFWMDTTEATIPEFKLFKPDFKKEHLGQYYYEPNSSIDNCYWHWAIIYCNWRSKQEGFDTCYTNLPEHSSSYLAYKDVKCDRLKNGYRLPTEAEWEYACRAGSTGRYFWGGDSALLPRFVWYQENFRDTFHTVASKPPNAFGLYDMLGGMLEMTNDWYDSTYYHRAPFLDPAGPLTYPEDDYAMDPRHIMRGGFFLSSPDYVTSTARLPNFLSARHPHSLRCARTNTP